MRAAGALDAGGPADGAVPPATGAGPSLAQDDLSLQHPVLRRLSSGLSVGQGVRRSAVWATGSRVVSQLVQLVGVVVTARLLTPDDYGKAALIFPVTSFAGIFSSLGMGSTIIHARRVTERLLSTAFWLNAVSGVLLAALLCGLAFPFAALYGEPVLVPLLCLASLSFALSLSIVHNSLLERTLRFKAVAVVEATATLMSLSTVVLTALAGAGPFALVLGPLAYTVTQTTLAWAVVRWRPHRGPDRQTAREIWSFSRGITGFNVVIFWSRNADNLLLGTVATQAELGNYNRAYNLMKLPVNQMQLVMGRVLFPALSRLRDDPPRLGQAWLRALSVAATLTAPVTYGLAVSAPALVEVAFGRRWLGMVTVLEVLAASALPQTLTSTVGGLLRATGATNALFRLGLLISGLSLVTICIGLPWGTTGVAVALAVKYHLEVYVMMRPCLRRTDLRWADLVRALRGVWTACAALAVAGLAVRLTLSDALAAWQVLLPQVAVCGVAYVGTLALVDREPLLQIYGLMGGRRRPKGRHARR